MKNFFLTISLCFFIIAQFTFAQIPQTMSYQGVLTDANGNPVSDGSYSLTFKLFDVPAIGDSLWKETQNVQVTSGLFNVILGSVTPLNLPFDKQYWMGISVGSGSELSPRTALTASPYSLNSHSTITEPLPGQGLTIRNSSGEANHQFDVNGDVTHNGVGKFLGGIFVGDTIITPIDTTDVQETTIKFLNQVTSNKSFVTLPDIGTSVSGTSIGVYSHGGKIGVQGQTIQGTGVFGFSETFRGVHGRSLSGTGVKGYSVSGTGVWGISQTERGVLGQSTSSSGVWGISETQYGVYGRSEINRAVFGESSSGTGVKGFSTTGDGIIGESTSGAGVWGLSQTERGVLGQSNSGGGVMGISNTNAGIIGRGLFGGLFQNKVKIDEVPQAPNQGRFLVWDADSVVKYRTLPAGGTFDGVLQDKALVVKSGQTEVFRVNTDGTSHHKGTETFEDSVIIKNIAIFEDDINVKNGEVRTRSIVVVDGNNNPLTRFNSDGTSLHTGLETYLGGIDLPDHNLENTTGNVKAGKFNGGMGDLSTLNKQQYPRIIEVPNLETGTISFNPAVDNEPVIWGYTERTTGPSVFGQNTNTANTYPAVWGANFGGGAGLVGEVRTTSSSYPGVWAITYGTGTAFLIDHQGSAGNIFLGRSAGTNKARIDKTGKGFFNGGTQTGGADLAEAFKVEGIVDDYEPGDVMVISVQNDRTMTKSKETYSTLVAGVYATKPGVLLTERNIDDPHDDTVPLGVVGVIPTKVSSENGSIQRGDLLVTSSIPGHAMKGSDRDKMMGAVLGKALENFDGNGTGVIKVLVNTK